MNARVTLTASAPGKLLLFGEYAVLDGAPALVTAIDRRVELELRHDDAATFRYHVRERWPTPGSRPDDVLTLEIGDTNPAPDASPLAPLTLAVLDVLELWPTELAGIEIDLVRGAMHESDSGIKLGVGSSAASCVALVGALAEATGRELPPEALLRESFRAHRQFQNGRGSGVDVAASTMGGVLRYTLHEGQPEAAAIPRNHLPPWRAVWIGHAADTREFLTALESLAAASPEVHAARLQEIRQRAEDADALVAGADIDGLLECVSATERALEALGEAADIPIVTDAHRTLSARADALGLVAKPSGAGGGDLSLVFGDNENDLRLLDEALDDTPLVPMSLHTDPTGFRLEADAPSQAAETRGHSST